MLHFIFHVRRRGWGSQNETEEKGEKERERGVREEGWLSELSPSDPVRRWNLLLPSPIPVSTPALGSFFGRNTIVLGISTS